MIDPDDEGELALDVGRRLQQVRQIMGLSQQEFGEAAGLSQTRYNNYECGARLLTLRAALSLCKKYALTLDYVFLGDASGLPFRVADELRKLKKNKA